MTRLAAAGRIRRRGAGRPDRGQGDYAGLHAGGSLHLLREPLRASRTHVDALRAALLAVGAPA